MKAKSGADIHVRILYNTCLHAHVNDRKCTSTRTNQQYILGIQCARDKYTTNMNFADAIKWHVYWASEVPILERHRIDYGKSQFSFKQFTIFNQNAHGSEYVQ